MVSAYNSATAIYKLGTFVSVMVTDSYIESQICCTYQF